MSVREYIGARYVPLFADPIEWDNTRTYEPLTIVYYQGNSYTSRQAVPTGIAITNETYWALTGNYNAQIEAYREEVQNYAESVGGIASDVEDIETDITGLDGRLDAIEANNWVTTARIANESVTTPKLADGSVTNLKIASNTITKDKLVNDDIFLLFGDSWGDFSINPDWATGVNKVLGCGSIENYCVNGATFVYNSNNTVAQQIATAKTELTADEKNNVKYIVIMAGVNDHHPAPPSGYDSAVEAALRDCANSFPNAVIQWFPTSCAPAYDNNNGPKWLYSLASFWHTLGKFQASSATTSEPNRFCFPKTGGAFYFNQNSRINVFFNSTLLHLSNYGRNAIVNSILQGFGKLDFPVFRSIYKEMTTGRPVVTNITPTDVTMFGDFSGLSSVPSIDYDAFAGERILIAMAGQNCERMYNGLTPGFLVFTCINGGGIVDGYCTINANTDWTGAKWSTNSSFSGGTRYICK